MRIILTNQIAALMNSHLPIDDESLAGMLGDLQTIFSSVTGRCEFNFHIWILDLCEVCTHNHSHANIINENDENDDKIVDVENIVKSENATEDNVEVEKLFKDGKN